MAAKRKYKWEAWFGMGRVVLVRGIDYQCSQSAMMSMVRTNAWLRRVRVSVQDTGNTLIVEVRGAIPHTDSVAVVGECAPALAADGPH